MPPQPPPPPQQQQQQQWFTATFALPRQAVIIPGEAALTRLGAPVGNRLALHPKCVRARTHTRTYTPGREQRERTCFCVDDSLCRSPRVIYFTLYNEWKPFERYKNSIL